VARWPFLRGEERAIARLAGALGFRYAWDERTRQYAHPAVIFVITPDGRVSSSLHGVSYAPAELTAALFVAASGGSGESIAGSVLSCFRFDPAHRRYRAQMQRYFRVGAASIFVALALLVAGLLWWERRRRR
jgi:protein SCO1/2